jgi:hypothetical protein
MKRYLDKISVSGQYTEFPGVSVISKTSIENEGFWKRLHEVLSKSSLVCRYFSPLPYESYHLTTIDLCTEMANGGDDWGQFITDRLSAFKKLHTVLNENKIYPQIRLKSIRSSSVIQLYFDIPQEQRDAINRIAESFNLAHKVPKEMHITLAYQYKLITGNDDEQLKKYLEEEIQQIFDENPSITLESPALSYFNSMEDFKLWDAKKNPFIAKKFDLFHCFFHKSSKTPNDLQSEQESFNLRL